MKQNYKCRILGIFISLLSIVVFSQDIHFTFANAQNTNDGVDDFYEVDVMIQTVNTTGNFKLGSGQLYFTYNTTAFGENIDTNSNFEVAQSDDYICGQGIDLLAAIKIYGNFTTNDNTTTRVSWAFSQIYSSSTFATDNVTDTPTKLCHIKIMYADVNEDPMFMFEDGVTYDDQFYTACGIASGGNADTADCSTEPGVQLLNDTFDSVGSILSNDGFEFLKRLSLFPNPTKDILNIKGDISQLQLIEIHNLSGQEVLRLTKDFDEIDLSNLESSVYFVKVKSERDTQHFKVIKE